MMSDPPCHHRYFLSSFAFIIMGVRIDVLLFSCHHSVGLYSALTCGIISIKGPFPPTSITIELYSSPTHNHVDFYKHALKLCKSRAV